MSNPFLDESCAERAILYQVGAGLKYTNRPAEVSAQSALSSGAGSPEADPLCPSAQSFIVMRKTLHM